MFKECLIDIDFNLLVLNMTSLFEMSLLPGPRCRAVSVASVPEPCTSLSAFLRDGHSFGNPVLPSPGCSRGRDSHNAECSRSSWSQAPSQVTSPHPSHGDVALGGSPQWGGRCSAVNTQDGPWGRAEQSSSGLSWHSPAQERLCLQG